MKLIQRTLRRPRIEIIPMIDVIFFLLVFFMISSLAMTRLKSLPVQLPSLTSEADTLPAAPLILTLQSNGSLWINQQPTSWEHLQHQLAFSLRNHPQEKLVIQADEQVAYSTVIQAMDQAKKIGIRKFALATRPGS